MKQTGIALMALMILFMSACSRSEQSDTTMRVPPVKTKHVGRMLVPGRDQLPMFITVKDKLNLDKTTRVIGKDNVQIYFTPFLKDSANRTYACTNLGQEVVCVRKKQLNGDLQIGIMKQGEAILITGKGGQYTISDMNQTQMGLWFAGPKYHGGTGFCQLEPGETFANCYKAEKDEFCSDFASCLLEDLYPEVLVAIALSCTCKAVMPKPGDKEIFTLPLPQKGNYLDSTFKPVR